MLFLELQATNKQNHGEIFTRASFAGRTEACGSAPRTRGSYSMDLGWVGVKVQTLFAAQRLEIDSRSAGRLSAFIWCSQYIQRPHQVLLIHLRVSANLHVHLGVIDMVVAHGQGGECGKTKRRRVWLYIVFQKPRLPDRWSWAFLSTSTDAVDEFVICKRLRVRTLPEKKRPIQKDSKTEKTYNRHRVWGESLNRPGVVEFF